MKTNNPSPNSGLSSGNPEILAVCKRGAITPIEVTWLVLFSPSRDIWWVV